MIIFVLFVSPVAGAQSGVRGGVVCGGDKRAEQDVQSQPGVCADLRLSVLCSAWHCARCWELPVCKLVLMCVFFKGFSHLKTCFIQQVEQTETEEQKQSPHKYATHNKILM